MEELEGMLPLQLDNNKRVNKTPIAWLYTIDYDDDITSPSNYREDLFTFRNTTQNDIIKIHINSAGGRLDTLIQLVNGIRSSEAYVIAQLDSCAYSAAGALFLQADEHVVSPNASLMIHESTYGVIDSADKLHKHVDFSRKHLRKCYLDYYHNFLTVEEIDAVLEGKDMWMDAEEIVERLKRRAELNAEEQEEAFIDEDVIPTWMLDCADQLENRILKSSLQSILDSHNIEYNNKDSKRKLSEHIVNNLSQEVVEDILEKA